MSSPELIRDTPPQRLFTTLIGRVLGLLLLTAAGLKAYGFGVDPVARLGIFSAPAFQFLVIIFEISLGVWLLSAKQSAGAWLVVLFTFSIFAAVSFYQGWIGHASCGCLGRNVTASPWVMFAVDLAAVAALVVFRPDFKPLWESRSRIGVMAASIAGGYIALLGLFAGFSHYQYGSIDAVLAALRGERVSLNPSLIDVGTGNPGEVKEAVVEVTNRTEEAIRLIGGTADCSCTVLGDLPVTIPPGKSRSITVSMHLPRSVGNFNRKALLAIDDQGFKRVSFRLTGRISKIPD